MQLWSLVVYEDKISRSVQIEHFWYIRCIINTFRFNFLTKHEKQNFKNATTEMENDHIEKRREDRYLKEFQILFKYFLQDGNLSRW